MEKKIKVEEKLVNLGIWGEKIVSGWRQMCVHVSVQLRVSQENIQVHIVVQRLKSE